MKFISWNVNGLRACVGKDFESQFKALDADFFCLQETKMQEGQLDLKFEGYESYWNYAEKKGYSGTAIYTRHQPLSVSYGMGVEEHDHEGRVITLEYDNFYLVTFDGKVGYIEKEHLKINGLTTVQIVAIVLAIIVALAGSAIFASTYLTRKNGDKDKKARLESKPNVHKRT